MTGSANLRCSFCGTHADRCRHLVKGRGATMICDACVGEAAKVIAAAVPPLRGGPLPPAAPGAPPKGGRAGAEP